MKYGVIICPQCRHVKGVTLSKKTTKCIHCGKILKLQHMIIHFKTNNQEELRQAIGIINAEMLGEKEIFIKSIGKK